MRTRSANSKADRAKEKRSAPKTNEEQDSDTTSTSDNSGINLISAAAAVDDEPQNRKKGTKKSNVRKRKKVLRDDAQKAAAEVKRIAAEAKKAAAAATYGEEAEEAEAKMAAAAAKAARDAESKRKQEEIKKMFASMTYFESTEAKRLFSPKDGEPVIDCIKRRVEILKTIVKHDEDMSFILKYVRKVENADPEGLTMKRWKKLFHRCQILLAAYQMALRDMHPKRKKTWAQCCQWALDAISMSGVDTWKAQGMIVLAWAKDFQKDELLPNPLPVIKPFIPRLFEDFPRAIEMGRKYCEKYLEEISSRSMFWFMRDNVVPTVFNEKWEKEKIESEYAEKRKQKVNEIRKRLRSHKSKMQRRRAQHLANPELYEQEKERKRQERLQRKEQQKEIRREEMQRKRRLERKRKLKEKREKREQKKRTAPPTDPNDILFHPDDMDVLKVREHDEEEFHIDNEMNHTSEEEDDDEGASCDSLIEDSNKLNGSELELKEDNEDDNDSDDCSTGSEYSSVDWSELERKEVEKFDQKEYDVAFAAFKKKYPMSERMGNLMLKWLGYSIKRVTPTDGSTCCYIWYKADQLYSSEGQAAEGQLVEP